jgi:hypothetical protein
MCVIEIGPESNPHYVYIVDHYPQHIESIEGHLCPITFDPQHNLADVKTFLTFIFGQ